MPEKKRKKLFFHVNEYQKPIIYLVLVPSFMICLVISVYIFYMNFTWVNLFHAVEPAIIEGMYKRTIATYIILWLLFILTVWWAFQVSSKLVGAFERLLQELDDVVSGKSRRPLKARKNDALANALLERINAIIAKL